MTRKITDEEKKLWKLATRGVRDKGKGIRVDDFLAEAAKVKIRITPVEEIIPNLESQLPSASREGKPKGRGLRAERNQKLVAGKINAMDGGSFRKLLRGRQKIEARIDLHGMWLSEAHVAVRDFLQLSYDSGKRCVLVITGKGGISGDGKIRAELPKWLNDPDIRRIVLSFSQSRPEHGGSGAFYVYLRK